MLTKQERIQTYDWDRQLVVPDRLTRTRHACYVTLADEMLSVYHKGIGKPRKELHREIERCCRQLEDCPLRRIAAFCKLLDDASEFHKDRGGAAAKLRQRVFALAASHHPLVETPDELFDSDRENVKQAIAEQMGMTWPDIESRLFADVIEFHSLRKAPTNLDAIGLLARYNVAQTQAALYSAVSMTVWASSDFKMILRYAKLARLMHRIEKRGDDYLFHFDGPASVLRQTRRYGVNFARFLPGLLSTRGWKMRATVLGPRQRRFRLILSDKDGLHSEVDSRVFDSQLEEKFATQWKTAETFGWRLEHETTVLHQNQKVFTPDFTLTHPDHGRVQLEVVGFWTPEYLEEKARTIREFQHHDRIILAIAESVQEAIGDLDIPTVIFKTVIKPSQVLNLLSEIHPSK